MMNIDQFRDLVSSLPHKPIFVDNEIVKGCKTYREACRKAWEMKTIKNMTYTNLALLGGFYRPHVGDWFNPDDKPTRRSLPAEKVAIFEVLVGNKLVSQWIAFQSDLKVQDIGNA